MTDPTEKQKWPAVSMNDPKPTAVWLTKRIEAMLSHYYQPTISIEADLLAAATWIDVLGIIPKAAIEMACREWECSEDRRPTPAAIRKRALAHVTAPAKPSEPAPRVAIEPPTADELQRRREIALEMGMDQYAPSAEIIDLARRREARG